MKVLRPASYAPQKKHIKYTEILYLLTRLTAIVSPIAGIVRLNKAITAALLPLKSLIGPIIKEPNISPAPTRHIAYNEV